MSIPGQDLATLVDRCERQGVTVTAQRRAVLENLSGREDHPTADEVHLEVTRSIAGVSRATVYRTLETLVERGLMVRVLHPGASTRYDLKVHRHHHLVCDVCGSVADLVEPGLDALPIELPADRSHPSGFQIRDYSVSVRGVCGHCSATRSDG
ncbi:MAG: transcriptional repressor [Planctomycetota bacterium]|nr:transcriptional repressor [Planctomycetota bacterium]